MNVRACPEWFRAASFNIGIPGAEEWGMRLPLWRKK